MFADCWLSEQTFRRSSIGTFEEAYWIFLRFGFLPLPIHVSSGVYFPGKYLTLLAFGAPLLCIDPYIYMWAGCCLSETTSWPYFEWYLRGGVSNLPVVQIFPRSGTCIIEGVLSWSIPYIVDVSALLLLIDPYIYLRADCWLSEPDLPTMVQVGPSMRHIESSCGRILPRSKACIIEGVLSRSITYVVGIWCSAPYHWSIHISVGRLLTVRSNLPAIVWVRPLMGAYWIFLWFGFSPVPINVSSRVYYPGQSLTLLAPVLRSFSSIHTYICGQIVDFLSLPFNHSLINTFEEAYWIFLWFGLFPVPRHVSSSVYSPSRLPRFFTSVICSF